MHRRSVRGRCTGLPCAPAADRWAQGWAEQSGCIPKCCEIQQNVSALAENRTPVWSVARTYAAVGAAPYASTTAAAGGGTSDGCHSGQSDRLLSGGCHGRWYRDMTVQQHSLEWASPWHHGSAGLHSAMWHLLNQSWCATCCQPHRCSTRPCGRSRGGWYVGTSRLILGESTCASVD